MHLIHQFTLAQVLHLCQQSLPLIREMLDRFLLIEQGRRRIAHCLNPHDVEITLARRQHAGASMTQQ